MEHWFKNLFSRNEIRFIGFFAMVFIGSALLLSVTGLLPSELRQSADGGVVNSLFGPDSSQIGDENNIGRNSALGILDSTRPGSEGGAVNGTGSSVGTVGGTGAGVGADSGQIIVPDRLMVPSLKINTIVKNPVSTNITVLDNELKKGAVRYPGSGSIGKGNMFIFGHSTGFSVVQNPAYKVFNDLKKLTPGQEILLQSGSSVFAYKVNRVVKVDKNEALIKFDTTKNMLTISTCDSFGAKNDRYVVEADFVGVRS